MGVLSGMIDLLFPPRCIFCGSFLKRGERDVCSACSSSDLFLKDSETETEGDCFSECRSVLRFEGTARRAVLRYKFKGVSGSAEYFGRILAGCIRKYYAGRYDYITWVPLSEERLRSRGYDQAFLLAAATAAELDDAAVETLRMPSEVRAQDTIEDRAGRKANVLGAYTAPDHELLSGRRILLIDDIVTTGATLSECARTLLLAGAEDVICATLAKA